MTIHDRITDFRIADGNGLRAVLLDGLDDPFLARFQTNCPNVFISRAFLESVQANLLQGQDRLVLVGIVDTFGLPVAFFPFALRKRLGASVIEGIDFGLADYFAPCLTSDREIDARATDALWADVLKVLPPADAVTIKKMPRQLYGERHALSRARFVRPMSACATTLALRHVSDPDSAQDLPSSLAREVKRKTKKLEAFGKVEFRVLSEPDEIDATLDALVALRRARFSEMRRRDILMYDHVIAFYRQLARPGEGPAAGRLFTLKAGDRLVAALYAFTYRGVFTLLIPAISEDKDVQVGSPGTVALFRALEWAREQGYRYFDLSVGSLHYKTRFHAETVELFEYQKALTLRGRIITMDAWVRRSGRAAAISRPWIRDMADAAGRLRMRLRGRSFR